MQRGTTPTIRFKVPFDTASIEVLEIAFAQQGRIVLEKHLEDCALEDDIITMRLSQAETLSFDAQHSAEYQLSVKMGDGTVMRSKIYKINIGKLLKEGEI